MAATSMDQNNDLCPFLATEMKIQVKIEFGPNDNYPFTTRLVGYKPNHYLVLDYPRPVHEALLVRTINNSTVVIRGMSDTGLGHIVAFKTSIIQSSMQPFPMLFIRMPRHFVTKPIRQHKRIKLSLPASLNQHDGPERVDGTLVDFSVSGCGVFVDNDAAILKQSFLQKDLSVSINSALTSAFDDDIDTRIASIVKQTNGHIVGLRFSPSLTLNEGLKNALFEYTVLDNLT